MMEIGQASWQSGEAIAFGSRDRSMMEIKAHIDDGD